MAKLTLCYIFPIRYGRVDISAGRFALMAKAVTFTSTTTVATRVMLST